MKSDPTPDAIFGHGFADIIDSYDWDETIAMVENATIAQVDAVLAKAKANKKALTPYPSGRRSRWKPGDGLSARGRCCLWRWSR